MRRKIEKIVPGYAVLPLLIMVIWNLITYYGTRLFTWNREFYILETVWDPQIPFVPVFVYGYILAFAQWVIGYLVIIRDAKETCDRVLSAEIIGKVIIFTVFMILPTTNVRPAVPQGVPGSWLIRLIYWVDAPRQLFPSIHCLESYVVWRGTFYMKKVSRGYQMVMLGITLLVFASTLLTKQHLLLDVIGGVTAAEIGFLAEKCFAPGRLFDRLRKKVGAV